MGSGFGDMSTSYSEVEKSCYEREFLEVSLGEDDAKVSRVADHLARSQMPRRTLKEAWRVGNPDSKDPVGRSEFFLCCRLIGHCQILAEEIASHCTTAGCTRRSWNAAPGQACCRTCREDSHKIADSKGVHCGDCNEKFCDQPSADVLQEGGEQLRILLLSDFKQQPPSRLPDFYLASR